MKKIIFLFLIFSAVVFAKWEISTLHTDDGETGITFTTYDYENKSVLNVFVYLDEYPGHSSVGIGNERIEAGDDLSLIIEDNEGDTINYNIFRGDIIENMVVTHDIKRGNNLTKMLYNGKHAVLYNNDTDELLASFDLKGLQKVIKKHAGSSYWYRYILNSIYD